MSETPQKYREIARSEVDALKPFDSVTYSAKLMRSLVNDADRLAKLEDGIRALADKYHDADAKQPGAVVRADTFESELRALLDGE